MPFDFNQIPIGLETPGQFAEIDKSRANTGIARPRNKTVIIGQRLNTGAVAAATLVQIYTGDQGKAAFGRGSMLAGMVDTYRKADPSGELWCIALDDLGGGAAQTRTLTFGGAPTAAGKVYLQVCGRDVTLDVASGASLASIATAAAAAVNALPDLPVTASAAAAVTTVTSRHKGESTASIDCRYNYNPGELLPTGLTLAVASGTAGTGNPDVTTALTVIGDTEFSYFVHPYADATSIAAIEAFLATRADALHQSDGASFAPQLGTFGAIQTAGAARNSEFGALGGVRGLLNPSWEFVAAWAAQVAFTVNSEDPGVPWTGLPLIGIKPPLPADRWTRQERQYLIEAGVSTFDFDSGALVIDRVVTTYKTNGQGLPDKSLQDLNSLLLLYYLRWSMRNRIATKFRRYKLGSDGGNYRPGAKVVTPSVIRAELLGLFLEWEADGLVEDFEGFRDGLVVDRDANNPNRVNAILPPDLINQFLIFAAKIQFRR